MKIESTDQDIRNILASGYYRIPRFQRPYSWTRENIQQFWDDIVKDSPPDYFIGSMVVFKESSQRYAVVDGQQRLTTITIFLAVLRDILAKQDFEDLARGIHNLIERKNIDNKSEYVLSTDTSYPFFQDHILKWGEPEVPVTPMREEENLKNAFDHLHALAHAIVESHTSDPTLSKAKQKSAIQKKLIKIRDAILDLKVILVKMDDEDDAYVVFETLNTRGKDLSLADLLKNHITKHLKAKSASVDQPKIKWGQLLETIEGSSCELEMDRFIHHFWLSRYDYLPLKGLFKQIKSRIGKSEAKQFLDDLLADASVYRSIHEVHYGKWTKQERRIEDALRALQLFRVQQQTPCVLSLVRAYRANQIKKKHFEEAVVAIEKFHFLFTAVTSQRSSGGISGMYASLGRRLFQSADANESIDIIRELTKKLRERVPSLDEVKALLPEILYTDRMSKDRLLVKYILTAFGKQSASGVATDYDVMTIEHLIPQSAIDSGDLSESIVGQLGNLILVSPEMNGKLGNKPFAEKKHILKAAHFPLPPEIEAASDWTSDNVKARTESMASDGYMKVWKI